MSVFARSATRDGSEGWHSYKLPKASLSPREAEVCQLLLEGLLVKEVAYRLNISYRTAETHRRSAYQKLGLHNRAGLFKRFSNDPPIEARGIAESVEEKIIARLEHLEQIVHGLAQRSP